MQLSRQFTRQKKMRNEPEETSLIGATQSELQGEQRTFSSPAIQPLVQNGFAQLPAGDWLAGQAQPAACCGTASVVGLRGWLVPDRAPLRRVTASGNCWFSEQEKPFLTRLDALPDEPLHVVSSKLLVAPYASRVRGGSLRLVPLSIRSSLVYTDVQGGWVVVSTASRVTRVSIKEEEVLTVRPESVVAWVGRKPTGFCPKLSLWELFIPRNPASLSFSFHGPAVIWFEGSKRPPALRRNGVPTPIC